MRDLSESRCPTEQPSREELRSQLAASELERIRLRAGLIEALDGWLRVTNRGIPAALEQESITKIAELRKLVTP